MKTFIRRSRCAVPLIGLALGAACGLEEREPGLVHPTDSTQIGTTPDGLPIIETRLENPFLRGFFPVDLAEIVIDREQALDSPLYFERETYSHPTAPLFTVGGTESFGWLDVARGDLAGVTEFRTRGPRISLTSDGTPTPISMYTASSDGSGGIERELVDAASYVLHPDVLVLPVSVVVFVDEAGNAPFIASTATDGIDAVVEQMFDPAASHATGESDGDLVTVTASWPEEFLEVAPDSLLAQCNIQFHLDRVEVVAQDAGLEVTLSNSDRPCRTTETPLGSYLPVTLDEAGAIPVFVGGEITVELLSDYLGFTCPPASPVEYIAVDGDVLLTPGIVAHELGHFVGLQHTAEADNLMNTPDFGGIAGQGLVEEQCSRARCDAARLLQRWGRIDGARAEEVCAPFAAMCGDGVTELGERCDDGNDEDGDGCRSDCTPELCGDARLDPGESCDWGLDPENCDLECNVCPGCTVCGDGEIDPYEECDPPDGTTCDASCKFTFI